MSYDHYSVFRGGGESEGLLIVDHSDWGLESPNCPVNTGCQLSILLACCNLLKQLAASLWITSLDNQLATSQYQDGCKLPTFGCIFNYVKCPIII